MSLLSGIKDVLASIKPGGRGLQFGVLFKTFRTILERNNRIRNNFV